MNDAEATAGVAGQSGVAGSLAKCPCGKTPDALWLRKSPDGFKWAFLTPTCCNEWTIEFNTNGLDIDDPECMALAAKEWNGAPREKPAKRTVQCPGHLVKKWIREAEETILGYFCFILNFFGLSLNLKPNRRE